MPRATLRNATDTWVDQARPSLNRSTATRLQARAGTGQNRYIYLHFNRAAPKGATILSATLTLFYAATATGTRDLTLRRIADSWRVSRTTWNNRPDVTGVANTVHETGTHAAGTAVQFDVTHFTQQVSDGAQWYGLRLETTGSAAISFYSTQANRSEFRPTLQVSWSEAPDPPSQLIPSGGQIVGVPKPVVRFDFTDDVGDTSMQALQFQTSASTSFTNPGHDTGVVASTLPEFDTGPTGWLGFREDIRYWRVRVQDGAGLWSGWSDLGSAIYKPKGTVTINNPAPSPNNVLWELTPPIDWAFSVTQRAWQVRVWDVADPTVMLADSHRQTGTETEYTLPSGTFHVTEGHTFVASVRCWDTEDRVATPGVPVYSQTNRQFTIDVDQTLAPVENLVATPERHRPRVLLTWTRASAPDHYHIIRDGVRIEDNLQADDTIVSGINNEWLDDTVLPWREHRWKVRAVVNGRQANSPTVEAIPQQYGIWLFDKERHLEVWLAGNEEGSWAMGEEATETAGLNAVRMTRRIQSQRGHEGSLSGILVAAYGRTAQDYEDDLLAMRDRPTRRVTLALADVNLRVLLGNIAVWPTPTPHIPPIHNCSFDFWEQ